MFKQEGELNFPVDDHQLGIAFGNGHAQDDVAVDNTLPGRPETFTVEVPFDPEIGTAPGRLPQSPGSGRGFPAEAG